MKLRTEGELYDYLTDALAWRKIELSAIVKSATTPATSIPQKNYQLRSAVALLYAHWEGFVKEAGTAYLNFVVMQGLPYADLTSNFVALAMKSKLDQAKDTNKATIYSEVSEFFLTGLTQRCSLNWQDAIQTQSNLSSIALREIIHALGLDYSPYQTKEKLIDEKLLLTRNNVAHGQYLPVGESDYLLLHQEITYLLQIFFNQISNAASQKSFKRP